MDGVGVGVVGVGVVGVGVVGVGVVGVGVVGVGVVGVGVVGTGVVGVGVLFTPPPPQADSSAKKTNTVPTAAEPRTRYITLIFAPVPAIYIIVAASLLQSKNGVKRL